MPNLPDALLHFVLKVFAPFMYKTALKVLQRSFKDPDGPLPARMRQKSVSSKRNLNLLIHDELGLYDVGGIRAVDALLHFIFVCCRASMMACRRAWTRTWRGSKRRGSTASGGDAPHTPPARGL
jgi:hypothetical protein